MRELTPGPCIIYERVSTPRQVTAHVQAEVDLCLALAAEHAFPVMEVFVDEGATGFNANRAEYKRMLAYIYEHSGTLRYIVVPDLSRLWRDPAEYLSLRLDAANQGVVIVSAREQAVDDSREGLLIETALAWKAADEVAEKKRKAVSAIERLVADGLWPFRPPLGYLNGQPKGYLVPDPKAAPAIRQLFDWVAVEGLNLDAACQRAQEHRFRTSQGHLLTHQAVRRILTNRLYAGRIELKSGLWATASFSPLVSPTVFDAVQSHLSTKVRQQRRKVPQFPLGGFMICDECGYSLSGSYANRIYGWYRCKEGCSKVRSADLHAMFAQFANELTSTEHSRATFHMAVVERTSGDVTQELDQVSRELETVRQRKQKLIDWRQEDAITQEEWQRNMDRKREEERLLGRRLDEITARRRTRVEKVSAMAIRVLERAGDVWAGLGVELQRRLQEALFPERVVFRAGELRTHAFNPVFSTLRGSSLQSRTFGCPSDPKLEPTGGRWLRVPRVERERIANQYLAGLEDFGTSTDGRHDTRSAAA